MSLQLGGGDRNNSISKNCFGNDGKGGVVETVERGKPSWDILMGTTVN